MNLLHRQKLPEIRLRVERIEQGVVELDLVDRHDVAFVAPLYAIHRVHKLDCVIDVPFLGGEVDCFGQNESLNREPVFFQPFICAFAVI